MASSTLAHPPAPKRAAIAKHQRSSSSRSLHQHGRTASASTKAPNLTGFTNLDSTKRTSSSSGLAPPKSQLKKGHGDASHTSISSAFKKQGAHALTPAHGPKSTRAGGGKKTFEILSADEYDDDWVSSESGAATPVGGDASDVIENVIEDKLAHVNHFDSASRQPESTFKHIPPKIQTSRVEQPYSISPEDMITPFPRTEPSSPARTIGSRYSKRSARPGSMHGTGTLPPLLIRTPSYSTAYGVAAPYLTPHTTETHMATSDSLSTSPSETSISSTISPRPRKASFSSVHSIEALPTHSSRRERTSSALNATASTTALSSLSAISHSQPNLPYVSYLPKTTALPMFQELMPSPYLPSHLTVTRVFNPLRESFTRVAQSRPRAPPV
ncbi:hypothetical protein BOTBODRAFT_26237 [Botryobasidium botryosum FD-172 SS1]|uniref:Uncharacterized protein n=1 Tax=Botryobasidium botryosum (strain FD-172 SS1) TaxID=930990 RepID=A0A067NDK5_BOTB1|nr:hypothetical protein BOTBODRAFT_26237 [Botryobasidium botryosum FD-172 SS1]